MKLILCVISSWVILANYNAHSKAVDVAQDLGNEFVRDTIEHARKRIKDDPRLNLVARFCGKYSRKSNDGSKTKFTDLDMDCLYLILLDLNLTELLNMADINDNFSTVAAAVFHHKYSHLEVVVRDDIAFPEKSNESFDVNGKPNTGKIGRIFRRFGIFQKPEEKLLSTAVESQDIGNTGLSVSDKDIQLDGYYETLVNVFKHFGQVIKRLKLTTTSLYEHSRAEFMGNLISNYISDSLLEISFDKSREKLFAFITKPLINVEMVRFKSVYLSDVPVGLVLNELFPAMRSLELDSLTFKKNDGRSYIDCSMPHLEHVYIKGLNADSDALFTNFIMKNPQIRSVDLYDNYPEFVQKMNVHLSQLQNLKLTRFTLLNGNLRFKNVISFFHGYGTPNSLHFPKLQTLRCEYRSQFHFEWIDFLSEHNRLNQLHLEHWEINDSEFQRLIAKQTDLVEITLERRFQSTVVSIDTIVEFLRSHDNVKLFNVINYSKFWGAELQEKLKEECDAKIHGDVLSFERKTNT